jgi:hypothetical protein
VNDDAVRRVDAQFAAHYADVLRYVVEEHMGRVGAGVGATERRSIGLPKPILHAR